MRSVGRFFNLVYLDTEIQPAFGSRSVASLSKGGGSTDSEGTASSLQ